MEHLLRCPDCLPRTFTLEVYVQPHAPISYAHTAVLLLAVLETKNRTLEEAGTVFDEDGTTKQVVCPTQNSSSTHSTEDNEKPSETFIE